MPNASTASLVSVAELVVGQFLQRRADHPDLRRQRGLDQVGHAGQQLALGQVAGRAEQDDDVRQERVLVAAVRAGARRRVGDGLRSVGGHDLDGPLGECVCHRRTLTARRKHARRRTAGYCRGMAASDSREVVIEATPEEILDVIADVEATPDWSPQYQKAVILESYPDGRPKQVEMTVKAAGLTDVMVIEYTWTDNSVTLDAGVVRPAEGPGRRLHADALTATRPRCGSTWRSTCRSRCPASC